MTASATRLAARALVPGTLLMMVVIARAGLTPEGGLEFTLFDDAMISMTYARTLVETGEWVWFPGADRVQGFTNPLWTLYMALLHLLGLHGSNAALAVSVTGACVVLGCAAMVSRLVRDCLPPSPSAAWSAAIAAGTIPFLYPLVFWSVRGMEVGLIALLILMMADALHRERWIPAGVFAACAVATRLDAVVPAVAMLMVAAWHADAPPLRVRLFVRTGGPLVAAALAILGFQEMYWGDWLTNTYRLKMEGYAVIERLSRGLLANAKGLPVFLLVGLGCAAALKAPRPPRAGRLIVMLTSAAGASLAYSIWVGGDAWEWTAFLNRYVTVTLPAAVIVIVVGADTWHSGLVPGGIPARWLTVLTVAGLGAGVLTNPVRFDPLRAMVAVTMLAGAAGVLVWALRNAAIPRTSGAVALLIVAASSGVGWPNWVRTGGPHVNDDLQMSRQGRLIAAATTPDAVIATVWAGASAYYAHRPMIDLLGKNDTLIAAGAPIGDFYPGHNKWNYAHSIHALRPDMVTQLWVPEGTTPPPMDDWGYQEWCLTDGAVIHVRRSSDRVNRTHLLSCEDGQAATAPLR